MAECGYLASLAVAQLADSVDQKEIFDEVVKDVVDFTSLYYVMKQEGAETTDGTITNDMFIAVTGLGKDIHEKRTTAMSPSNALMLSNRMLNNCRAGLRDIYTNLDQNG